MARTYLDEATEILDAELRYLATSGISRRAARQRYLEDVFDEMADASWAPPRCLPLARLGDRGRHALVRWEGELTQGPPWSEPQPIYVEVEGPTRGRSVRLEREVSSAVTCLLDLVREHEAEILELRSRLRVQRRDAERVEGRVEALEWPAGRPAALVAGQQQAPAAPRWISMVPVVAAVASVPVMEMMLLSRLVRSDGVLVQVVGHVMAAAVAVVIYYVVAWLVGETSSIGASLARRAAPHDLTPSTPAPPRTATPPPAPLPPPAPPPPASPERAAPR
jgi:hypothetical protein